MALGTDLHVDLLLGGTGREFIATVAGNFGLVVGWMDSFFHDFHLLIIVCDPLTVTVVPLKSLHIYKTALLVYHIPTPFASGKSNNN